MSDNATFSSLMEKAIRTAIRLHEGHTRKTDRTLPYTTHLFHVAFIIQAHGFPEHILIAALLHDSLEDTDYTPEDCTEDFGEEVCSVIRSVTENKLLNWDARKRLYLENIRSGSVGAKAVCCADKIHNLAIILEEYQSNGDAVWKVFTKGKNKTLRFYLDALDAISDGWSHPIVDEYRALANRAAGLIAEEKTEDITV